MNYLDEDDTDKINIDRDRHGDRNLIGRQNSKSN